MFRFAENVPLFYLVSLASILLFVAIINPIANVIVRFRADYTPRHIQLAAEDGVVPSAPSRTGVTSVFGIIGRIWKIEGFQGFFKGYVPTASISVLAFVWAILFVGIEGVQPGGKPEWPSLSPWQNAIVAFFATLLNLPLTVITYRAIVTPHKLGWFNVAQGYKTLLSPSEQSRPYRIFTLGLFSAGFLRTGVYLFGVFPLRRLLLEPGASQDQASLFLLTIVFATLISTPLEVLETRLAIQRNHKGVPSGAEVDPPTGEEVIGYRAEDDPYKGLLDAADRISREEGWYILYRAWWVTLLGSFGFFAA